MCGVRAVTVGKLLEGGGEREQREGERERERERGRERGRGGSRWRKGSTGIDGEYTHTCTHE